MGYFGCFGNMGLVGGAFLFYLGFVFVMIGILAAGIAGGMRILFRTRMSQNFGIEALVMLVGAVFGVLWGAEVVVALSLLGMLATGLLCLISLAFKGTRSESEITRLELNN